MNIYLHVEIAARELDSKLLIAVIAASRGHHVTISDDKEVMLAANCSAIPPGIFHTKSLTPSVEKIRFHESLCNKGFLITSLDEEGGLIFHGYEDFAKMRYSEKTIKQAAAVFTWGPEDFETLQSIYPRQKGKIYQTGSPRVDLWRPLFWEYWGRPNRAPREPFLLISSNMGSANNIRPLYERLSFERNAGYFQRDPTLLRKRFLNIAEDFRMTLAFIDAIENLSRNRHGYQIILRPHPVESIEAWRVYLDGIPNVQVLRDGSITPWVNHAFAVMHNGCTTSIEATVSGTPVITYLPAAAQKTENLPNELGNTVTSIRALSELADQLFERTRSELRERKEKLSPTVVTKKIHIDDKQLAAEKIVSVWETFASNALCQPSKVFKMKVIFKIASMGGWAGKILRSVVPKFPQLPNNNPKFPPMEIVDIRDRVTRLKETLQLNAEFNVLRLGDRCILIKSNTSKGNH